MKKWYTYFLLMIVVAVTAQNPVIDSLKKELTKAKHDTVRCNILSQITQVCPAENLAEYNNKLLRLAETNIIKSDQSIIEKKVYQRCYARAMNNEGLVYTGRGDKVKALFYFEKSIKLWETLGEKVEITEPISNAGVNNFLRGNVIVALSYFEKSLKLQEETGNKQGQVLSLIDIGGVYYGQGDLEMGLEYFKRSYKLGSEIGDQYGLGYSLNCIGLIYHTQCKVSGISIEKRDSFSILSLEYFTKSLNVWEKLGNRQGQSTALNNIGLIYDMKGDLPNALTYFKQSFEIQEEIKDESGMAFSLNNIGGVYLKQKKYDKAIETCLRSMQKSRENKFSENIRNAAERLSLIYRSIGNHKLALENYELFIQMRDSIANEETKKASIKSQLKYEYEKMAAADSVKAGEEKKVVQAQLKQEKTQRYSLYGGLALVLIFALFMVNRFRVTNKQKKLIGEQKKVVEEQKHLVDEKQKEILDSIYYARRIQRALITNEKYIARSLKKLNG